jgi:hypothetical protein
MQLAVRRECFQPLWTNVFYGYNSHWHLSFGHGKHFVVCQLREEFDEHVLLKSKERRNVEEFLNKR